eukprot:CCRYP_011608-RA/>CCRYP_011608-RA protein AED:0.34 eAED:0.34 QI:151/1/1/1/0/0.5/2/60/336
MMKFNTRIFLWTILVPASSSAFTPSIALPASSPSHSIRVQSRLCPALGSTLLRDDVGKAIPTDEGGRKEYTQVPGMEVDLMNGSAKSYLDDGFVFGLDGSGLERPKGKVASVVVEGDSLETTPQQIGIVSATFAAHFYFAANAIAQFYSQSDGNTELTAVAALGTIVASWILADFGSGVFHWAVDNYGNGRTPVMGSIIAAFQGHHSAPWTITYRGFCNNVWKLCIPFVFCAIEIMSQELHKWSHMTVKETPTWVNTLQDLGISIGRVPHAKHHLAPYDGNYCIVSGICNEALDNSGFFRWMEHRIYEINGIESNAWKLDPELRDRTLRGQYQLQL